MMGRGSVGDAVPAMIGPTFSSWPGLTRPSSYFRHAMHRKSMLQCRGLDGRVKPGHDGTGDSSRTCAARQWRRADGKRPERALAPAPGRSRIVRAGMAAAAFGAHERAGGDDPGGERHVAHRQVDGVVLDGPSVSSAAVSPAPLRSTPRAGPSPCGWRACLLHR
jgi:hypothetical protein